MNDNRSKIIVKANIIQQISETVGSVKPETGGLIGSLGNTNVIDEYVFDKNGGSYPDKYVPCVSEMNAILKNIWSPNGIFMVGLVHSHIKERPFLSCGDVGYAAKVLENLSFLKEFIMPIVTVDPFEIEFFSVSIQPKLCVENVDYSVI